MCVCVCVREIQTYLAPILTAPQLTQLLPTSQQPFPSPFPFQTAVTKPRIPLWRITLWHNTLWGSSLRLLATALFCRSALAVGHRPSSLGKTFSKVSALVYLQCKRTKGSTFENLYLARHLASRATAMVRAPTPQIYIGVQYRSLCALY